MKKDFLYFIGFVILAVGGFFISILLGSAEITFNNVINLYYGEVGTKEQILLNIRLPRTIVAALVGMSLAVSGGVLQGIMKNPLADPHIIGISSGAGLCGIFVLLSYPEAINFVTPIAFIGAMGAAVLIYILAYKGGIRPVRMILAGVAVSAFLGAGISAMLIFYSDRAQSALLFMVGGLSARSWPHVEIILPYAALGIFFAILGARTLNILQLGDESAKSLGVSVEKSRLFLTATAALLAASAVSVAGLLGFIGLIVPHAARLLIGSDFKKLIPASALLGAATLTIADTVARVAFSPTELPVGILTAILGAPFFLYLLRREV
ncbi:MAG: iron ABC transporter permease [Selenomonadaceae bacterium]|nr:iron ABC transporter permease [Selenomonadaceae bacterium]